MTSTWTKMGEVNLGNMVGVHGELDVSSYSTSGEDISPGKLGGGAANWDHIIPMFITTLDRIAQWDRANKKLIIGVASTGAQVASGNNTGKIHLLALSFVP